MNYSKDSRNKMNESSDPKKTKKKKKTKKAKVTTFRILLIAFIIGTFAIIGSGLGIFIGIIKSAPDISELELKPTTNYTSFIYDQDGNQIDTLDNGENRVYANLEQIPKNLQDAVVAVEDERFYTHHGIDIKGIFRAIVKNLQSGKFDEGASTITQQLIKNNILTSDKKITRKIQEQYLALQFERIYEKELILEYYLNTIALGNGNNGVQAAANFYFAKDVSELTLRESVVLAGITQYPTRYDPIRNPEKNHEKSLIILNKMVEQGMITEEERQAALEEDPYKEIAGVHKELETSYHTYFVDAVIDQVIKDLETHNGMTRTQANNLVFGGGVSIHTTLDPDMQSIVDKHMSDDSLFPSKVEYLINYTASIEKADGEILHRGADGIIQSTDDVELFKQSKHEEWGVVEGDEVINPKVQLVPQAQAAFVVMDHNNGHVKALSGGRGEKYGDRTFNRATHAERQPGSTFKILSSYAPALDMGLLAPGSVIVDEAVTYNKGTSYEYSPKNWYSQGYRGPSTVREGVYDSMNILAVKTLDMVGIDTAYNYLLNFGFTTLSEQLDKGYALTLGGISSGVTPLELNAAYAAIANDGVYIEPILYTEVRDRDGNLLLDNSVPESHTVIKESTASMLTDMMEDTITRGTGGAVGRAFPGMPIAGKTGTTSDDKDFLFAGYTPYYTATVWMGYDNPKKFKIDGNKHLTLWGTIMEDIHEDLPSKKFDKVTTGYMQGTVCRHSGDLVTDLCKADPNHSVSTDYFLKDNFPTKYCDAHGVVKKCTISGKIATEFCPPETVTSSVSSGSSSSSVNPEDLCDVHTADSVFPDEPGEPTNPEWPFPDIPGWPTTPKPEPETPTTPDNNNNTTTPEVPTQPESPNPPPIPEVKPVPPEPNPDDDDSFYIPQG